VKVVVDWDGTVTEIDGLHLVLLEFGDEEIYEAHEARLGRELTLHEVIAGEFRSVRAPLPEVVEWMRENARLRPGFAEFARAHRPLVVSSGFHELIEPVLEREGVLGRVELRANRVEARPNGWCVHFRVSDLCDECGEACKRADLPAGEIVYAGDGHSDYCASLAADRVFAIGGLARWLERRGVRHEPLTDFHALASEL
jgi:2-hydroxy-3-keto-5-methylthiopentenyl-1-phosphate phosphatase